MTQPDLFTDAPRRRRKAVNVPATSVLAYQEQPRDARVQRSIDWTEAHYRAVGVWPTSAELAQSVYEQKAGTDAWFNRAPLEYLLEVRRGLSDALALGLVEHAPARKCAVSGRTCLTWRVKLR